MQQTVFLASKQYVWGARYIDDLLLRDESLYMFENGLPSVAMKHRRYALTDPNWNTVAITDSSANTLERYRYNAYGTAEYQSATFGAKTSSDHDWEYLFTNRRLDLETGCMYYRNRYFHPMLGRFQKRDSIGYGDGINLQRYVKSSPILFSDPSGQVACPGGTWGFSGWIYGGMLFIIGTDSASVTFKCKKGNRRRKRVYCCDGTEIYQYNEIRVKANGTMRILKLGVGLGGSIGYFGGVAYNAENVSDLNCTSYGFGIEAGLFVGVQAGMSWTSGGSLSSGSAGVAIGIEAGASFQVTSTWASFGGYDERWTKLSLSEQAIVDSNNCSITEEPINPQIPVTW